MFINHDNKFFFFFSEELKISQYFLCIQWKSMVSNVVLASLILVVCIELKRFYNIYIYFMFCRKQNSYSFGTTFERTIQINLI